MSIKIKPYYRVAGRARKPSSYSGHLVGKKRRTFVDKNLAAKVAIVRRMQSSSQFNPSKSLKSLVDDLKPKPYHRNYIIQLLLHAEGLTKNPRATIKNYPEVRKALKEYLYIGIGNRPFGKRDEKKLSREDSVEFRKENIKTCNPRVAYKESNVKLYVAEPQNPASTSIFVHGLCNNEKSLAGLAREVLSSGHRVALFSPSGHSSNAGSPNQARLSEDVASVFEFIGNEYPGEPVNAVTHSMGSASTISGLRKSFNRSDLEVNRLMLIGAYRNFHEVLPTVVKFLITNQIRTLNESYYQDKYVTQLKQVLERLNTPDGIELVQELFAGEWDNEKNLEHLFEHQNKIAGIDLIHGSQDEVIPTYRGDAPLYDLVSKGPIPYTHEVVEGAGHTPDPSKLFPFKQVLTSLNSLV